MSALEQQKLDAELRATHAQSTRKIIRVIRAIPRGRVMTYGQVAEAAGLGRAARLVGNVLLHISLSVPWHRVLGKRSAGVAKISIKDAALGARQRFLLEKEGVEFSKSWGVSLERFGHHPRRRRA